ncbi:MAG: AAA family ATPase [Gemmataceae bacterium]|nr:AAA family ATPase [Gemmataceae bacterium]
MLIAMAGLPGSGKSTLAARLAAELDGVVLSKDTVRVALFPSPVLDYSSAQNEISMDAVYSAAAHILKSASGRSVLIDGRTFLRSYQVHDLFALAESVGEVPRIIECVCSDEIARQRLDRDLADGLHPARNRTFDLYRSVKARAEPIATPHLTLDTGVESLDGCIHRCLEYLGDEKSDGTRK